MEKEEKMRELTHLFAEMVVYEAFDGQQLSVGNGPMGYAMASRWFKYAFSNCVLAVRKNTDYSGGLSPIKSTGMVGIATRIIDKAARLFNLVSGLNRKIAIGDETPEDTLRDLSNYGIIGVMLQHDEFDVWQDE